MASTTFWLRQITPHTLSSMIVPSSIPVRIAALLHPGARLKYSFVSPTMRMPVRNVPTAAQRNHHSALRVTLSMAISRARPPVSWFGGCSNSA